MPDDYLVVLLSHIPILTSDRRHTMVDKSGLLDVVKDRKAILALNGHTHYQEHIFLDAEDGWTGSGTFHHLNIATVSGAWWAGPRDVRGVPAAPCRDGVPNGYVVVTFDGNKYTSEFKAASLDRDYQMHIYPPGSRRAVDPEGRMVLVNVFDGSEKCRVEYSMDHGPFQPMTLQPQPDPLAEVLFSSAVPSAKPWATANVSYHIWQAELAERLERRPHTVTIRVTDHYGRVREQSRVFGW